MQKRATLSCLQSISGKSACPNAAIQTSRAEKVEVGVGGRGRGGRARILNLEFFGETFVCSQQTKPILSGRRLRSPDSFRTREFRRIFGKVSAGRNRFRSERESSRIAGCCPAVPACAEGAAHNFPPNGRPAGRVEEYAVFGRCVSCGQGVVCQRGRVNSYQIYPGGGA